MDDDVLLTTCAWCMGQLHWPDIFVPEHSPRPYCSEACHWAETEHIEEMDRREKVEYAF